MTIDDPSHAGEVVFDGKNYEFDADGKLEFVADKGENLYINTKEPYSFAKGCTYTYWSTGEGQEPQTYDIWGLEYKTYGQVWISDPEYCVYYEINLTTINLAEARNKTLTVNVEGNASKVVLQSNANSEHFPLQEGANTVKFMDLDCPFHIRSDSYGYWNITAEDGDILDIKADFPDKEVTITVNYEGDASPATISQFSVDNVPVEDKSKPVVAKMGQSLYFVADDSY